MRQLLTQSWQTSSDATPAQVIETLPGLTREVTYSQPPLESCVSFQCFSIASFFAAMRNG